MAARLQRKRDSMGPRATYVPSDLLPPTRLHIVSIASQYAINQEPSLPHMNIWRMFQIHNTIGGDPGNGGN